MTTNTIYPRHIEPRVTEALADTPVVLIYGPRQCGKSTFAQIIGKSAGYRYLTFNDEDTRLYATEDPAGFVNSLPERVILDEAQLAPDVFRSIKLSVDRDRIPGRFILTSSVDLSLMREIKALVGRMDIIRLHPFSQNELERTSPKFPDILFAPNFDVGQDLPQKNQFIERIVAGGYPVSLQYTKAKLTSWSQKYIETIVKNDVPTSSDTRSLKTLPKLLKMAARRTACLLNIKHLVSSLRFGRSRIYSYLILLEQMFLLENIPACYNTRAKRLIKTPKIHLCDTGIVCALLDLDKSALEEDQVLCSHILETFVLQELQRQASASSQSYTFQHFRNQENEKADIVIQRGMKLAGVEVKASATINSSDFNGLRKIKAAAGKNFVSGTLFYNGDSTQKFGKDLYALPLRKLWETDFD